MEFAVYQEQVLQIVRDLAGFSLSEADILRKAVGKKIVKLLQNKKKNLSMVALKTRFLKKLLQKVFCFY